MWWRVYYEREQVFTDRDGHPWDAPRVGVLCVVQEHNGSYETVHGRDHYYYESGRGGWVTSDIFGAIDHLMRAPRQCLLFGRQVTDEEYRGVLRRIALEFGPRDHRHEREYSR